MQTVDFYSLINVAAEKQEAFNKKNDCENDILLFQRHSGTEITPDAHIRVYDFNKTFYESVKAFCIKHNVLYEVKHKMLQTFIVVRDKDIPNSGFDHSVAQKFRFELDEQLAQLQLKLDSNKKLVDNILLMFGNQLVQGVFIYSRQKYWTRTENDVCVSIAADDKSLYIMNRIKCLCDSQGVSSYGYSYAGDDDGYPRNNRRNLFVGDASFQKIVSIFTVIKNEFQSSF